MTDHYATCPDCGHQVAYSDWALHPCTVARREAEIEAAKKQSKGLGDTIAKMTSAVGIKPCGGCKKRQKRLNELFPYGD